MVDGASLEMDTSGVHLQLGVPCIGVHYLADYHSDLDLGYGVLINYLSPSLEPSFIIRHEILKTDEFSLGLIARSGFHWNLGFFKPRSHPSNFGIRLNPAIVVGTYPHPSYSSFFLLEAPFLWTWGYGGGFVMPVRAGTGFEYAMTPDIRFVLYFGAGYRFEGGGGHIGGRYFEMDFWLGLSFRMF